MTGTSLSLSFQNYQPDSYPLNITLPNALYQSLAYTTSKLLASYVQDCIRREMPSLYPLYERAIKTQPSFDHYHRLREADKCIQARWECSPLPLSFRSWSVVHPIPEIDVSAIQDNDGQQIFHWIGETRESLTLRLAFRQEPHSYMPISVDPLIRLLGNENLLFRDGMITGCELDGKKVYLLAELHGSKIAFRIRKRLAELVHQGKIAWFLEGVPLHDNAKRELNKIKDIEDHKPWFGLEHLGYYSLTFCLRQIQESSIEMLSQIYWYLNWTQKGREIWQALADTYHRTQSELLKTAFVGLPLGSFVNKSFEKRLSVFDGRQLWPRLGQLILDHYPGMYLQKKEKETLSFCMKNATKIDKCIHLLVNFRDAISADAILSQQKNLPSNLLIVVTVGINHLHGLLQQIQAQSTGQRRTVGNWRFYRYARNFAYRSKFAERLLRCDN